MITIKKNFVADIYGGLGKNDNGEQPVNFQSEPRPLFVYFRGSIYLSIDNGPAVFPAQMAAASIPGGPYHVIYPNMITAQFQTYEQAAKIAGAWDGTTWQSKVPPILDLEYDPGPKPRKAPPTWDYWHPRGAGWANQVKKWLDLAEQTFKVRPWIYTSRNYANVLNGWFGPPAWVKDYQFIVAWYPFSPDAFDLATIPAQFIPAGVPRSNVIGFQYFAKGRGLGFAYNDLNEMADSIAALFTPAPAPAPAPQPEPGPLPAPVPAPIPIPAPARPLYNIAIRPDEWDKQPPPPKIASFDIIGGRGITTKLQIGPNEVKFIKSIVIPSLKVDNRVTWKWASSAGIRSGITIYYSNNPLTGTWWWGIGLMGSKPGSPRQFCLIEHFDPGKPYQYVSGIPYQPSGDYSAYTPDKRPEFWFLCYTIYPSGKILQESHNGLTFLMPFWDVDSGFKLSDDAAKFGGWIDSGVFVGPHVSP